MLWIQLLLYTYILVVTVFYYSILAYFNFCYILRIMGKQVISKNDLSIMRKLKIAREKTRLSQVRAAQLLKKTQSYISKIESGQSRVRVDQLKEFARIYKRRIEYFLK